jgi:sterol 3beta-glucosyltransferase
MEQTGRPVIGPVSSPTGTCREGPARVVILTAGTRGDVAPYTGLGAHLRSAGFRVTIATHEPFAQLVRDGGLCFRPIPGDLRRTLASTAFRQWQRPGRSVLEPVRQVRRMAAVMRETADAMREIGRGVADAIRDDTDIVLLSNTMAPLGYHIAEELHLPSMGVYLLPLEPTSEFPPALAGYPSLGGWGNRATARFAQRMTDRVYVGAVREQRSRLGLSPTSLPELRRRQRKQQWPVLHGYSPAVAARPKDWRAGLDVVGFWWPEPPARWQPPSDLVEFLDAGPPPVFVGFGSMSPADAEQLGDLAVKALVRAGCRGVIQSGWAGLTAHGADIIGIGDQPYDWLFPRMRALVHHAGPGTAAAGIRAGVPTVPVPVMVDQFFWASRLAALGVATPPIPLKRLTTDRLAGDIRAAVSEPAYRSRAQALSDRLRTEDGAGAVVAAVQKLLG